MPDTNKSEKRIAKNNKAQRNVVQKIVLFFVRIGKRLKSFFINMKAELKRVVWPDRKRLVQSTATVLAICLLAGLLLFIIDFSLGKILEGVGFYNPSSTTVATTTAATTIVTTETSGSSETSAANTTQTSSSATTANGSTTTAETSASAG